MKDDKQKTYDLLYEIVGEGGCAGACTESELYMDDLLILIRLMVY